MVKWGQQEAPQVVETPRGRHRGVISMQSDHTTSSSDRPNHRIRQFCRAGHDTFIVGRDANSWCRECSRLAGAARRAAYPEHERARKRASYHAHNSEDRRLQAAMRTRARVEKNPDRKREADKKYAASNPERVRAHKDAYRERNLDEVRCRSREATSRRRAILANAERAPYDYDEIVFGAIACAICGTLYEVGADRVLDHIIPLSRGGGDTPDNVQSAHRACNSRKGNRLPI
jgi:5-methylcytosine-specific restriction endonuclease McrA